MANLNIISRWLQPEAKLRRLKDREGIRSCKATLCSKEIDTDFLKIFVNNFFFKIFLS